MNPTQRTSCQFLFSFSFHKIFPFFFLFSLFFSIWYMVKCVYQRFIRLGHFIVCFVYNEKKRKNRFSITLGEIIKFLFRRVFYADLVQSNLIPNVKTIRKKEIKKNVSKGGWHNRGNDALASNVVSTLILLFIYPLDRCCSVSSGTPTTIKIKTTEEPKKKYINLTALGFSLTKMLNKKKLFKKRYLSLARATGV